MERASVQHTRNPNFHSFDLNDDGTGNKNRMRNSTQTHKWSINLTIYISLLRLVLAAICVLKGGRAIWKFSIQFQHNIRKWHTDQCKKWNKWRIEKNWKIAFRD